MVARPWRTAGLVTGAVVLPTVAFSAAIAICRDIPRLASALFYYSAIGVSVTLGLLLIWQISRQAYVRLLLCVVGGFGLSIWLFYYGFAFVCSVYRDCL